MVEEEEAVEGRPVPCVDGDDATDGAADEERGGWAAEGVLAPLPPGASSDGAARLRQHSSFAAPSFSVLSPSDWAVWGLTVDWLHEYTCPGAAPDTPAQPLCPPSPKPCA